jgi:hypothetical protein
MKPDWKFIAALHFRSEPNPDPSGKGPIVGIL